MIKLVMAVILTGAIAGTAAAQQRENLPPVLTPPPSNGPDMNAAIGIFQKAYAKANKPRIVIFWNRALNDEVSTSYEDTSSTVKRTSAGGTATTDVYGGRRSAFAVSDTNITATQTTDTVKGTRRAEEARRDSGLHESDDWRLEAAFQGPLVSGGARVIDRATIVRTTKKGVEAGDRANLQAIEASAIQGKADLVLEVLMTPDSQSPTGYSYRVDAKNIATGAVVTKFVTDAVPYTAGKKTYRASDRGFTATTAPIQIVDVGEQLALETMASLSQAWN